MVTARGSYQIYSTDSMKTVTIKSAFHRETHIMLIMITMFAMVLFIQSTNISEFSPNAAADDIRGMGAMAYNKFVTYTSTSFTYGNEFTIGRVLLKK
jgi:hypothetical protein